MPEKICLALVWAMFSLPLVAQPTNPVGDGQPEIDDAIVETEMEFAMDSLDDSPFSEDQEESFASRLLQPARFTLKHEVSNQISDPYEFTSNRSSIRIEYEKFFLDNFYIQFDSKLTAFWNTDHRARAEQENVYLEMTSRDAYLQFSKAETSIKVGTQILIWGESDGGAITDVISPRNLSELFFISIEESRVGQPMINLDQFFSTLGRWSLFYIPDAEMNEYPEEGTAYYYDPFVGMAEFQSEDTDKDLSEYGFSWKKSFGRSDISLMAASLIDNDFAYRQDGVTDTGQILLTRIKPRFEMAGITFNYARGNYLFSGEIAKKSPKLFNDSSLQLIEKDIVDAALRAEYSLGKGGSHSISLELVTNHINDWNSEILTPENRDSLILGWNNHFFNETLTVNLISIYNKPHTSYQQSLFMAYKWNNDITLNLDAFYLTVKDEQSELNPYRDQNNIVFKILYQF